ncbi:MAG: D-2-hydroxyacid dehydrogenase [Bryobacteraceae bacterium]
MPRILIDMDIDEPRLAALRAQPGMVVDLKPESLAEVEYLFGTTPSPDFQLMTKLRWMQIASAGYSQLFGHRFVERGIRATNARGCFDVPIAEWNAAMMVNLARDLRQMIRNQDAAVWDRGARFQREIRGLTVGLWGYGGIGRETARLAKSMGMVVHVLSRNGLEPATNVYCVPGTGDAAGVLPDRVFLKGQEADFLGGLDFLILAMPLTPTTEGIVGEQELRALRPTAYLLNPSRGPLVREEALLSALREGWIAGAAIDTHYQYPLPSEHPLWQFPNVILTPHISGSSLSPHFLERTWDIFLENVRRIEAGEPLLNELTQAQLSGA